MSPYFNRSEQLVQLFELYVELVNETEKEYAGKENWWSILQPQKSFNDVRFRKYQSDLLRLVEYYLIQEKFEQDSVRQKDYLCESILDEQFESLYENSIKRLEKTIESYPYRSSDYYYNRYLLKSRIYEIGEAKHDRKKKRPVEEVLNNIEIFSLSEKFRYTCLALSHRAIYNYEYDIPDLNEVVKHSKIRLSDNPNLIVYYQMYLTQVDPPNEEHYFNLKNMLIKYGQLFPLKEAEFVYFSALNYCIRKINRGKEHFRIETFELYKDLLEKNILTFKGSISPWHFKNITTIGLQVGEIDWVDAFIEQYSSMIPEKFKLNAVSFNSAQVAFKRGDYSKVLRILSTVEYDDITYNLNSKAIQLMTYYETQEIEALYSLMESFRTFLNRHKEFPARKRKSYNNLIRYTKKITKTSTNNLSDLLKIHDEIQDNPGTASIEWLREKIAERLAKAK